MVLLLLGTGQLSQLPSSPTPGRMGVNHPGFVYTSLLGKEDDTMPGSRFGESTTAKVRRCAAAGRWSPSRRARRELRGRDDARVLEAAGAELLVLCTNPCTRPPA